MVWKILTHVSSQIEMAKVLMSFIGKSSRPIPEMHCYLRRINSGFRLNLGIAVNFNKNHTFYILQQRNCTSRPDNNQDKSLQSQSKSDLSEEVQPITFNRVKETTKTASYLGVILLGVGVTGIMFFSVFSELFSSKSPNNVYSKALEKVISDTRVQDALGEPISGYGEENRRGRRQHVSHLLYEKDGEKRLRMKFYISGTRKRATVHLEMKEDKAGNYVYRYLFVELDDFGRHPIVFEDNRVAAGTKPTADSPSQEFELPSHLNMNLNFPDAELK